MKIRVRSGPATRGNDVAANEFRRALKWIVAAAILMAGGALWYLSLSGPLTVHMVVATTLGVLFSVVLGCGLFAAAFFSANSGYDQTVTDATRVKTAPANPSALPAGLETYRRTDSFTEATVPAALLADHSTKAGNWGLIHVTEGKLRYRVNDPRREPLDTILAPDSAPGVVEPTILHNIEPIGAVRFHVEFWRAPVEMKADKIVI
ncbi:MAG: DUF1971 domain-containing protein [Candidatus Sphingomonas colombiensis]|nr:DUF1971 domain-containing protein [Sphingomonas sp.]WEK44007.1 MAG: DUF1971 domain-containing protein [Sphingomonas sp.]